MSVRVKVREGEHIIAALKRLSAKVNHAYRRQWYKSRPGAYEKPSQRQRKADSLRNRNARLARLKLLRRRSRATVFIAIRGLYSRKHPFPRERRPFRSWRRWWGD